MTRPRHFIACALGLFAFGIWSGFFALSEDPKSSGGGGHHGRGDSGPRAIPRLGRVGGSRGRD